VQLDPIERLNLALCAGAAAAGLAGVSASFAASLALGAAIEAANFRVLHAASQRLFAGNLAVGRVWMALFGLRFALLAAAIGFALGAGADPLALLIGLSMIVPASLVAAWRQRPPIGEPGPAPPPDDPSWDAWNPWLARERDPADEDW
jgi:hypothetical protein